MMSPETRSFYTGYRLLTGILPVYVLTALFFTLGWYMNPLRPQGQAGFMFLGVIVFAGISRLAGWLGFLLSSVPQSVVDNDPLRFGRIRDLQQAMQLPLEVRLVDIGPVPCLEAAGGVLPVVWISTHTLDRLGNDELSCLLQHEIAQLQRGCAVAWMDLLWLVAWPLGWLLADQPLYYFASAVLFAWLWLRLADWQRYTEQLRADTLAARSCGLMQYARALARHLEEFESVPASPLRRSRLAALGLSPGEIDELLQD